MVVIKNNQHTISKNEISENAIKVIHRLNKAGYDAYLVGGGVRDLLLGKKPKDFDVTTNATPGQIRKLFRNCRLIGRRFRLAHVIFNSEIIEVSTFRGSHKKNVSNHIIPQNQQKTIIFRNNIFGSIEEDSQRRDFTINGLYYDISNRTVHDYVGGMKDLKTGLIRFIGHDPETSYREDPVRMLRAIRFAAKLNMRISPETAEPIPRLAILLNRVSPARLFDESLKLLQTGFGYRTYKLLNKYGLFQPLFPIITQNFTKSGDSLMEKLIIQALKNSDNRIIYNDRYNPCFLFASMFWYPLLKLAEQEYFNQTNNIVSYHDAFVLASNNVLNRACQSLAIPKSITKLIRNIWQLQLRMSRHHKNRRAWRLVVEPKFLIAYDLLVLRAEVEKNFALHQLAVWWKKIQVSIINTKKKVTGIILINSSMKQRYSCR